jgi:hypothetical protein
MVEGRFYEVVVTLDISAYQTMAPVPFLATVASHRFNHIITSLALSLPDRVAERSKNLSGVTLLQATVFRTMACGCFSISWSAKYFSAIPVIAALCWFNAEVVS